MQVREFVEKAFKHVGIEIDWQGERGSVDEVRWVSSSDRYAGVTANQPTNQSHTPTHVYYTYTQIGVNKADPEHILVRVDPQYFRPTEVGT